MNKPAFQSSTSHGQVASIAFDGVTRTDEISHTKLDAPFKKAPVWIQVDLQKVFQIHSVKIFNRMKHTERLHDASIFVSYDISMGNKYLCATFISINHDLRLPCKANGRTVQLWMPSGVLHIREMEVFANYW